LALKLGVIGGSGLCEMEGLDVLQLESVSTPFGNPSAEYRIGRFRNSEIVFLPRHGSPHSIPPHEVNYRANMFGFRELGVTQILSISATGGLSEDLSPGTFVLINQVIDMTTGRLSTFFDGPEVRHIDFTEPYCPNMRAVLKAAAAAARIPLRPSGTYLCTNGPRLESRAEIRLFSAFGADVVGMTGMPEAALARELELCYTGIAVVTNLAAGLALTKLTTTEVVQNMNASMQKLSLLLTESFPRLCSRTPACTCHSALRDSAL